MEVDATIPLAGVVYALQLLSKESKEDRDALQACLTLIHAVIQRANGDFQTLHPVRTYLQQMSLYLMEHLVCRVQVTTFKNWREAEDTSQEVLQCFYSLMEDREAQLITSATVMDLLEEQLPSMTDALGWDVPLVACLSSALALTSQLNLVISKLVAQSVKDRDTFGNSSRVALRMLGEAFTNVLSILRQRESQKSQVFVALVLARELVLHSVDLVEPAMQDEAFEQRLDSILDQIVELLELKFTTGNEAEGGTLLCTFQGQDLRVEEFPTAFSSLYVVSATRRRGQALPTNTAVKHLLEVVALKAGGGVSDLHRMLVACRAESETFSNALGLSMLLPSSPLTTGPEIQQVVQWLHDVGSEDEATSRQAAQRLQAACQKSSNSFPALLQILRAVGEVVCMQSSAEDQETVDLTNRLQDRVASDLPDVLGPAGSLLYMKANDETEWTMNDNIDFLSFEEEGAWRASILAHLICFLGAAHKSVNAQQQDLPAAIKPFSAFNDLDESALNSTFWPGVPDNWWQALRYSGLHKHLLPIQGNIVWAQCQCGYRYCFAECGAPASAAACPSPEGEGQCRLMNGGQGHKFSAGQQLIAVVVTAAPHGSNWPPIYPSAHQQFPAAFAPPPPSPGLFALTEADLQTSVTENDREAVSHSVISETIRQDWNQPLGKPPNPNTGLHPVSFRLLHLLVHASALIGIEMEWVKGQNRSIYLLQDHLRRVARMNPVRTPNNTLWYFMANIEADLVALSKLLNGTLEVATLLVHAVLHRLGSLEPDEQPSGQSLTSHPARVAYESWFHQCIVQPILGERDGSGNYSLPGVHALRRDAGQSTDPNRLRITDLLARRGLPTEAWIHMKEEVRAALLPHILSPQVFASTEDTYEELLVASEGGTRFVILRMLMAGRDEDGVSWCVQPELLRAASLAWILPFMQFVREKEGGKITMRQARTTTIQEWLDNRAAHEQKEAWIRFRNFEAAWNSVLASDQMRDGCGIIRLPSVSLKSPIAISCPIVDPEKLQHGEIPVGSQEDKPEHIAALGLHHLAASHNKLIGQMTMYLDPENVLGAHVKARLHPSAALCKPSGQCQSTAEARQEQKVRLMQYASASDLLVFPWQLEDACAVEDGGNPHASRNFQLDYKIGAICQSFFQVPWGADPPARGAHDFQAIENDLAWRLVAGRRPFQICNDMGEEQDSTNETN